MTTTTHKYSLFIAANDELSVQIIESELEEYNYSIKTTKSFNDVYYQYTKNKSDIVILTSLGLSALYIIGSAVKLKMFDPEIKLVIISNYEDENFINSLSAMGLNTVHKIPINFDSLHSHIQKLLSSDIT